MQTNNNAPLVVNLFWKKKLEGETQKYKEGLIKAKSMQRTVQGNLRRLPEYKNGNEICELVSEKNYVSFQDDTEIMGNEKYQLFAKGGKGAFPESATQTIDDLWNSFLQEKEKFTPEESKEFTKLFVSMRDALNVGEQYDLYRSLKMCIDVKQGKNSIATDLDHLERKLKPILDKNFNPLKGIKKELNKVKTLGYNSYHVGDDTFIGGLNKILGRYLVKLLTCGHIDMFDIDNGLIVAKKEASQKLSVLIKKFNEGYKKTLKLPQTLEELRKDNRFLYTILNHKTSIEELINNHKETNHSLAFTIQEIHNSAMRKLDDFLHCDIYMPYVGLEPKKRVSVADNLENIGEIDPWEGVTGIKRYEDIYPVEDVSAKKMFDTQSYSNSLTWQPKLIDIIKPAPINETIIKKALQEIKTAIVSARRSNMAYEA